MEREQVKNLTELFPDCNQCPEAYRLARNEAHAKKGTDSGLLIISIECKYADGSRPPLIAHVQGSIKDQEVFSSKPPIDCPLIKKQ